jgi:heparin/heparan-sulfate lyase
MRSLALSCVLATALGAPGATADAAPVEHPRLLVAERDAFSGLPRLRERWAAGERPAPDLPGLALSWLLSKDESFAKRAIEELRADRPIGVKGSNRYVRYLNRSLAFDWLYGYPGFDAAFKDAVAADLVKGAGEMLALQSLKDPAQASYHNHTARELAQALVSLVAVEGHPSVEAQAAPLRAQAWRALDNILEQTELVDPDGGYHESTDYMRITWAPLAMMAELRRTATGYDPAARWSVFRNMGPTYLYKVLPDGSEARDDDDEFPHLDTRDNVVLGYAVHRFKDPFAAWLLNQRAWLPAEWANPVLEFLWKDAAVVPRDPKATSEAELPRRKLFRGIGHLVLRDGWSEDGTWIELACGPYFAKHDHLDAAHFVVYHKGYLAIDAGADYTETESPHYLNHYRRTVAHNTMLVYQPGETFFWGENRWPAANDGGQRMDSSRFWNSVRSLDDWSRTRDLWDRCRLEPFAAAPEYSYARADATGAYQRSKVERFTRELVHLRGPDVLVVLDRVRATDPAYRKTWLLHGTSQPKVEAGATGASAGHGGTSYGAASVVTFEDGQGRLRVHPLLPRERDVVVRGGPGYDFWTPGDERGGAWGSGQNWPLDPPEGGPLPEDPYLRKMWLTFWDGIDKLEPSNRRAVVPGGWRLETSPIAPAKDDVFLHVLEIGDRDARPARRMEGIEGHGLAGAAIEGEETVLFADAAEGEATLPNLATPHLLLTGLAPRAAYEVQVTSGFAPGSPVWRASGEAGDEGTLRLGWDGVRDGRLRLRRLR